MPNHYEVLGIARNASPEQIRKAYRALAKKLHPDVDHRHGAMERFVRTKEAYEALIDPERRAAYDRVLKLDEEPYVPKAKPQPEQPQPQTKPKARARPAVDPSELLEMTQLLNRARYADAERAARRIIERDGRQAMAYAVLADVARVRGNIEAAAKYYAFAAQYDPNPVYQRKHEQMLQAMASKVQEQQVETPRRQAPFAVFMGLFVAVTTACYVVFAKETPVFPSLPLVSSWTLGLIGMLLMAGVAVGACLVSAGLLESLAPSQGAVMRVSPSAALGIVAALNFWLALMFYVLIGSTQNAFNASTSRVVGAAAGVVVLFTGAAALSASVMPLQVLLWGGNVVYLGALVGWFVADSLRRPA